MHRLGHTRSAHRADHQLQTPDTFVRTPIPAITGGSAIVHISPEGGARFTQYTAELEPGGSLAASDTLQQFMYVIEGCVEIVTAPVTHAAAAQVLRPGSFAYLSAGTSAQLAATGPARVAVIEKRYLPHPTLAPPPSFFGQEDAAPSAPLLGDSAIEVRTLLPDAPAFDFAVNTMTYQPGAALPMVEVHVMEHGLLMLAGEGIYRLGDAWYPVAAGDFIWMAPYCPQWFGALGKQPARYLIYKDVHRDPGSTREDLRP